jgi:hypothetical protein
MARQHEPYEQLLQPFLPVLRSSVSILKPLSFSLRYFRFRPLRFQEVGDPVYF